MKNKLSWHCMVFMLFVGLAGLLASPVKADSNFYGFVSTLDGAQQVPPNGSPAKGTAKASYDPATNKLNLSIIVTGISPTSLTGAHIHLGPKGSSGAVIVSLGTTTWQATPTGMTLSASLTFPEANELDLINGNTYFNLHTTAFAGGEIRGQIIMAAKLVTIKATPYDVSADGTTVVGTGSFGTNVPQDILAFKWTPTSGVQPIPPPANAAINCGFEYEGCRLFVVASAVSANGDVIAGHAYTRHTTGDSFEAFRWTNTAGYLGLDSLGLFPAGSSASGISDDGSTIVGHSYSDFALRWTAATGLVKLPDGASAYATSGNGAVSVGVNSIGYGATALMWPTPNQAVKLVPLIGGHTSSASAISLDALIVAGASDTNSSTGTKAVRWTATDSPLLPVLLDTIPNETGSSATGISGDGKTIVGYLGRSTTTTADVFVWTALTGKRLLADLLIERGLDVSNLNLQLTNGSRISRDANTLIGTASYVVPDTTIGFSTGYIVYLNPAVTLPQPPPPPPQPPAASDMVLTMTDSPDPVKRLFKLTYTFTMTNNGPSDTGSVVLTYTLPSNVSFVSLTANGIPCSGFPVVTCTLPFLAKGASHTVIQAVRPKSIGTLTATGSVTSILPDPNTANNKATVTTTVN